MNDLLVNLDEIESMPDFDGEFEPIEGMFDLQVVKSSVGRNSKNTGDLAKYQFKVVDGPYGNRRVFAQYNLKHENKTAQNIGRSDFKKLCAACGKEGGTVDPSLDLLDLKFTALIEIDIPSDQKYKPQSIIKKYFKLGSAEASVERRDLAKEAAEPAGVAKFDDDDIPF